MKTWVKIVAISAVFVLATALGGCASCSRWTKSVGSDLGGGIHRKVTLYSNTGEEIKSWEGTFDVDDSEEETYFDNDDKRVIIHGGIVVNEEL